MGLFGGYNTPGPGVSKDEPEKKPFFKFFELYFRKFWKLMVANLLYVLVSLPVVTRGLAEVGLTHVTRQFAREKHVFLPSDFFEAIKKNWKQGLVFGILELVLGAAVAYSLYFYWAGTVNEFSLGTILPLAIALFITMMFVFTWYYVYIQIITFKMSFKQIIKNSVLFAAGGVKQNFILTLVQTVIIVLVAVCLMYFERVTLGIVIPAYLLVYPAFRSFMIQFTVFPLVKKAIIDPYYKEHPGEDIEKRRELNLEAEDVAVTEPEKAPIFTDAPHRERETPVMPKQYGEDEMRRGKKLTRGNANADDDGTI